MNPMTMSAIIVRPTVSARSRSSRSVRREPQAGAAGRRFRPGEDREKEKEEGALAARGGGGGHGATLNKLLKVVFMNRTITLGK